MPALGQVSIPYASSEIIVEIIVIAEKCPPGIVLITQVTALCRVKGDDRTARRHHANMSPE
jgi:hypothetical protein